MSERVLADGIVEQEPNIDALKPQLKMLKNNGIDSIAITFIHAWKYPAHEALVAKLVRDMGFTQVSVSHEVSPLVKLIGRGDTTVVDAYLSPILRRYVEQVSSQLGNGPKLSFMM